MPRARWPSRWAHKGTGSDTETVDCVPSFARGCGRYRPGSTGGHTAAGSRSRSGCGQCGGHPASRAPGRDVSKGCSDRPGAAGSAGRPREVQLHQAPLVASDAWLTGQLPVAAVESGRASWCSTTGSGFTSRSSSWRAVPGVAPAAPLRADPPLWIGHRSGPAGGMRPDGGSAAPRGRRRQRPAADVAGAGRRGR